VEAFLEEKAVIMDRIIRRALTERGLDPDELIARNLAQYNEEEEAILKVRAAREQELAEREAERERALQG